LLDVFGSELCEFDSAYYRRNVDIDLITVALCCLVGDVRRAGSRSKPAFEKLSDCKTFRLRLEAL